jgi:2-polyprenyl-6-methoxyphenol hydroxylase-like FAD-dependent oxidoreductase
MRVIVVGAGVGGLTLAQGLRQAGVEVRVYERDAPERRRQGISLHVDERGMAALRACLPPAHLAMVESTMGRPRERTQRLAELGGELAVVRAESLASAASRARPGRQVDRPLLRAVLLHGLADAVRFDVPFSRFETVADGTVRAWFGDGSTDTADVLVGADGVGSAVRSQHLPHVRVVDTGQRMVMGAAPLRAVADTGLLALIGDNATSAHVGGSMVALGALRFTEPPVAARDRWLPDLRASAVTEAQDYVMWALSLSRDQLGPAQTPHEVWHRARKLASDLPAQLRVVVDNAWPDATVALRIAAIPPAPAWPASPVTVIGDAIHAAPGFGGNLAMQDAHRLRDALAAAAPGRQDLLHALSAFEDRMRQANLRTVAPGKSANARPGTESVA